MNQTKLFQRDFTMVVIGQIISLFGNEILRYALPLYLLNQTHSASLFGIVSACSFLPMLLLSPVGGLVADRVNKRNVMVILDFSTAALVLLLSILLHQVNLILLLITVLMLLYGIQGAYQPTVQASIPLLVSSENLMSGNAVINLVSSLAGLIGPVLGGILFAACGLEPVLYVSIVCFIISAVMEIFIHIPFVTQPKAENILHLVIDDMKESFHFITKDTPILGKVSLLIALINMIFSSLIIIGIPILVNESLGFSESTGNRLYGYAQGALAAGGLIGGMLTGVIGKRLTVSKSYHLITLCTATLLPMCLALVLPVSPYIAYLILVVSCVFMMALSTVFSIEVISYTQKITPSHLLGKVMALLTCLVMCAHPVGQLMYGVLFEIFADKLYIIFFGALVLCLLISYLSKKIISQIPDEN